MNYKSLKQYTNQELIEYLHFNETHRLSSLGAICSEILRRMLALHPDLIEDQPAEYED